MSGSEDWKERAACRGMPVERFFPVGRSDSAGYIAAEREALEVCAQCPVVSECLRWAVEHAVADGVWGGYGEVPRRGMIAAAKRAARERRA